MTIVAVAADLMAKKNAKVIHTDIQRDQIRSCDIILISMSKSDKSLFKVLFGYICISYTGVRHRKFIRMRSVVFLSAGKIEPVIIKIWIKTGGIVESPLDIGINGICIGIVVVLDQKANLFSTHRTHCKLIAFHIANTEYSFQIIGNQVGITILYLLLIAVDIQTRLQNRHFINIVFPIRKTGIWVIFVGQIATHTIAVCIGCTDGNIVDLSVRVDILNLCREYSCAHTKHHAENKCTRYKATQRIGFSIHSNLLLDIRSKSQRPPDCRKGNLYRICSLYYMYGSIVQLSNISWQNRTYQTYDSNCPGVGSPFFYRSSHKSLFSSKALPIIWFITHYFTYDIIIPCYLPYCNIFLIIYKNFRSVSSSEYLQSTNLP